jgi:hypothetical protein
MWRDTDSFTVSAPDYEGLVTIADCDIVAIEDCRLDGEKLAPVTVKELDEAHPGWTFDAEEGTARWVTQMEPNSVTLYPRQEGTLTLRVVLRPSIEALTLPDWLLTSHGNHIGKGTAARCMLVPRTEHYSPDLAAPLLAEFTGWLNSLRLTARKGQQGGKVRSKPVMF